MNEIEKFLIDLRYTQVEIKRKINSLFLLEVNFSKDSTKFKFEIVIDDDTASYRHDFSWHKNLQSSFGYQTTRWVADMPDDAGIIKILKRRLNQYNKYYN